MSAKLINKITESEPRARLLFRQINTNNLEQELNEAYQTYAYFVTKKLETIFSLNALPQRKDLSHEERKSLEARLQKWKIIYETLEKLASMRIMAIQTLLRARNV